VVADGEMLTLETLTLAPIDKRLVDVRMLSEGERNWLNQYHQKVWDKISPDLNEHHANWLKHATSPI
jgi:hypothetical protein